MSVRIKYIQVAGDAVIPLLGFYFWDWSLYFILLFYFADLLISEVFTWVRSQRVRKEAGANLERTALMLSVFSLLFLACSILLINNGVRFLHPELEYLEELIAFWSYKDMGIQQGYLLLPLLILVGYQQYRMEFIMTGRFRTLTVEAIWREQLTGRKVLLAVSAFSAGFVYFVRIPDELALWLIITGIAAYTLFLDGRR